MSSNSISRLFIYILLSMFSAVSIYHSFEWLAYHFVCLGWMYL